MVRREDRPVRPASDHGKGMVGTAKNELCFSTIPARALYQAMAAAIIPKYPPAFKRVVEFASANRKYPAARRMNAIMSVKKSEKNMMVDLRVQSKSKNVNTPQQIK